MILVVRARGKGKRRVSSSGSPFPLRGFGQEMHISERSEVIVLLERSHGSFDIRDGGADIL